MNQLKKLVYYLLLASFCYTANLKIQKYLKESEGEYVLIQCIGKDSGVYEDSSNEPGCIILKQNYDSFKEKELCFLAKTKIEHSVETYYHCRKTLKEVDGPEGEKDELPSKWESCSNVDGMVMLPEPKNLPKDGGQPTEKVGNGVDDLVGDPKNAEIQPKTDVQDDRTEVGTGKIDLPITNQVDQTENQVTTGEQSEENGDGLKTGNEKAQSELRKMVVLV